MRAEAFRPPLQLAGRYVDLVPLAVDHVEALHHAARDPETYRLMILPLGPELASTRRAVEGLLDAQRAGKCLPFATRLRSTGTVVGMTRFLDIDPENHSVQIGGTFLDSAFWRSPLNTDAKLAMMRHAFETGGVHRLWLQTDLRNERSQRAIERLGAVREGVHREDRTLSTGAYRSSVVYSVLAPEWPAVRTRLESALERPWSGTPTGSGASA